MKAFKIDPKNKTIEEIVINRWQGIYQHISEECCTFCCPVQFENDDTIYADDEGLFHTIEGGIIMKDWKYPILGNTLLIGEDREGDIDDVKTSLEELQSKIIWVSKELCLKHKESVLTQHEYLDPNIFFNTQETTN